ncbi:diaminobutyrate acetyltransferase [Vibrio anguillarum]|uniref:diaminobutyrate acetyltransferase n=1 Tax=Vibrio anguillarum TaxID=55601 RepID=UPI00188CA24F|nr:diaminobutyrate acetyltransferase [Vibrio anguillarum]MBF4255627.1 diaminobutyrate acetyltransferase [Vibrio anguillarum]MBF4299271.1 diaminobutyrate acetyltransferase [Vibrio anguillarum]MBF4396386.1 diaminobutyrate acetyltransferase [Vibrio anguillarum]MBF4440267.1 diaminobutyrate acetyltransferase [Vibrio anguillarum]
MWQTMITAAPWVAYPEIMQTKTEQWTFRTPNQADGQRVHDLIGLCPPLDENSSYCNFLQAIHFQETCILAERNGETVGFISAYLKPDNSDELFIWQVAVHPNARGLGLASHLLHELLARDVMADVRILETTITKNNQGSWSLFKKFDRAHGEQGEVSTFLDQTRHFEGEHDTEYLYRIPLKPRSNLTG